MDSDQLKETIRDILFEEGLVGITPLADKWNGGELLMKPGKPGMQEKSVPIDVFDGVVAEVKTLVVPEGGELPPEEELAALEAAAEVEAAAAAAAERTAEVVFDEPDLAEPAGVDVDELEPAEDEA